MHQHRSAISILRRATLVAGLSSQLLLATGGASLAQLVTFDPSNYSQNILTAARSLEQINNQIRSLENDAQLLINSGRNLVNLPNSVAGQLTSKIAEINALVSQAKGIAFDLEKTTREFERLYPRQYSAATSTNKFAQDATERWTNTYEALRQTLKTQALVGANLEQDGETLRSLMAGSSSSVGSLQAQQSGNELLALQVKQSLQTQALMAAQARAEALRAVEQQASAEAARERFIRFIGDGRAYPDKR